MAVPDSIEILPEEPPENKVLDKAVQKLFNGDPRPLIENQPLYNELDPERQANVRAIAVNGHLAAKELDLEAARLFESLFPFLAEGPGNPEFDAAAKRWCEKQMRHGDFQIVRGLFENGTVPLSLFSDAVSIEAAKTGWMKSAALPLRSGKQEDIRAFIRLPFPDSFRSAPEVLDHVKASAEALIARGLTTESATLMEHLETYGDPLNGERLVEAAKKGMHVLFETGELEKISEFQTAYPTTQEERPTAKETETAINSLAKRRDLDGMEQFLQTYVGELSDEVSERLLQRTLHTRILTVDLLAQGDFDSVERLYNLLGSPIELVTEPFGHIETAIRVLISQRKINAANAALEHYHLDGTNRDQMDTDGIALLFRKTRENLGQTPSADYPHDAAGLVNAVKEILAHRLDSVNLTDILIGGLRKTSDCAQRSRFSSKQIPEDFLFINQVAAVTGDERILTAKNEILRKMIANGNTEGYRVASAFLERSEEEQEVFLLATLAESILDRGSEIRFPDAVKDFHVPLSAFEKPPLKAAIEERMRQEISAFSEKSHAYVTSRFTTANAEQETMETVRQTKSWDRTAMGTYFQHGEWRNSASKLLDRLDIRVDDLVEANLPPSVTTGPLPAHLETYKPLDAWYGSLQAMLKLQGRSSNQEHDPWITDFDPLVATLTERNIIDRAKPEDGAILLEYVRTFGMLNAPLAAETFVHFKRGGTFSNLASVPQTHLIETVGARVTRMNPEQLINELRQTRLRLQSDLLEDKLPPRLFTEMGDELFRATVGATIWGRTEKPSAILHILKKSKQHFPNKRAFNIPDSYRDPEKLGLQLTVRRSTRRAAPDHERVFATQEQTRLVAEPMVQAFIEHMKLALTERELMRGSLREWWKSRSEIEAKKTLGLPELPLARPGETGTDRKKSQDELIRFMLLQMASYSDCFHPEDFVALSLAHMNTIGQGGWEGPFNQFAREEKINPDHARSTWESLSQYVYEHYLSEGKEAHDTSFAPLPDFVRRALLDAWGWQDPENVESHPFGPLAEKLDVLEKQKWVTTVQETTTALEAIPVTGALRTYAGDVADACYTSKHKELARGKYGGVRSLVLMAGRDSGKAGRERLVGSVLFVEATTSEEKRVLVIRANNPRQNLLSTISVEDYASQTIAAAVRVAEREGFDLVALPVDSAGQSSSNRPDVSAEYRRRYTKSKRVMLKQTEDTTFNGYQIWNAKGRHGVVAVWEREAKRETV